MSCEIGTPASSMLTATESGLPVQEEYITKEPKLCVSKDEFCKPLSEPDIRPSSSGSFAT